MFETYRPSGRFGMSTLVFWAVGVLLTVALAFVYQLGLDWIPLIYISALLTAGFGMSMAFISSFIVDRGHCRNRLLAMVIGLSLLTAGVGAKFYFQYVIMLEEIVDSDNLDVFLQGAPEGVDLAEAKQELEAQIREEYTFMAHIEARVEQGFNIGRAGRNGGAPISGVAVYAIWLIELGVIAYFSLRPPVVQASEPYSEKMGQWASELDQVMLLPISDTEMVETIRQATSVDQLLEIPIPKTDETAQFASYQVQSIPGEEMEDAYLTVDLLTFKVNKEGGMDTITESLVRNAILTSAQRYQLQENAELLNEALAEYRKAVEEEAMGLAEAEQAIEEDDLGEELS